MSIPFGGTAAGASEYRGHSAKSGNTSISFSRFSEITVEERKDRISAMISEIYTTIPMSRAHYGQGGRSLHDSMKKYASMDHVSDVGSTIMTAACAIPARYVTIFVIQNSLFYQLFKFLSELHFSDIYCFFSPGIHLISFFLEFIPKFNNGKVSFLL